MKFSKELLEVFKKSQFFNTEASLYNMNNGRTIDTEPDEEGYVYIPEMTNLHPTSLVKNGDDEDAEYDYVFITKLINEFRDQVLELKNAKAGMKIKYIGDSIAFGGSYSIVTVESTYLKPADCPESEKGKLMIIEFKNDDIPMFFPIESLEPGEWILNHGDE